MRISEEALGFKFLIVTLNFKNFNSVLIQIKVFTKIHFNFETYYRFFDIIRKCFISLKKNINFNNFSLPLPKVVQYPVSM